MRQRAIEPNRPGEDWEGNNIAVTCPVCGKVYIVSEHIHRGERPCPVCGDSTGHIRGGRESGGHAEIRWRWAGDDNEAT